VQIVCTRSAEINPEIPFFRQPIPRWLLTTTRGGRDWRDRQHFDRILCYDNGEGGVDLQAAFAQLKALGIDRLAVLGGGSLIAQLCALDLIDELWLTVCPLLFGGSNAPTPLDGVGLTRDNAPKLRLLASETVGDEVFLHYRVVRD
jgi:5-amino-6-(5-phosphoribosylamino)uracil reductase